jgi:hypothetical protein
MCCCMSPSNGHESAIAQLVDRVSQAGGLTELSVMELSASLTFTISRADGEFLMNYVLFRLATPAVSLAGAVGREKVRT